MDPITLIVTALAAGALKGVGEAANSVVKDSYEALKRAVREKVSSNSTGLTVLTAHADDPETYERPLAKELANVGADSDTRIIEAAQRLLALIEGAGTAAGKYSVTVQGANGVQVGDGNTQNNTFN